VEQVTTGVVVLYLEPLYMHSIRYQFLLAKEQQLLVS
jgi:hypothetical protein